MAQNPTDHPMHAYGADGPKDRCSCPWPCEHYPVCNGAPTKEGLDPETVAAVRTLCEASGPMTLVLADGTACELPTLVERAFREGLRMIAAGERPVVVASSR